MVATTKNQMAPKYSQFHFSVWIFFLSNLSTQQNLSAQSSTMEKHKKCNVQLTKAITQTPRKLRQWHRLSATDKTGAKNKAESRDSNTARTLVLVY